MMRKVVVNESGNFLQGIACPYTFNVGEPPHNSYHWCTPACAWFSIREDNIVRCKECVIGIID